MAMDQRLWRGWYAEGDFPKSFVCPKCFKGNLILKKDTVKQLETGYSVAMRRSDEYWEPEWCTSRFVMFLMCDRDQCGEIVSVSGDIAVDQDFDENSESMVYYDAYVPRSFYPAPRIIDVPENAPDSVRDAIDRASHQYWSDKGACANSLRTSLESLLDHLKVPRFHDDQEKKRMNLLQRIEAYADSSQSHADVANHAESMNILRDIGNVGSHGEGLNKDVLLNLFELYEYTLEEILGVRRARAKKLRDTLNSRDRDK